MIIIITILISVSANLATMDLDKTCTCTRQSKYAFHPISLLLSRNVQHSNRCLLLVSRMPIYHKKLSIVDAFAINPSIN